MEASQVVVACGWHLAAFILKQQGNGVNQCVHFSTVPGAAQGPASI